MYQIRHRIAGLVPILAFLVVATGCETMPSGSNTVAAARQEQSVYAQVIFYHAVPGRSQQLERVLDDQAFIGTLQGDPAFINERVLKPIDDFSLLYITYTKFSDRAAAERYRTRRLNSVSGLVRRAPEAHIATLDAAYTPAGIVDNPKGREFGGKRTGQNAHVALFVPQADYMDEYFRAIAKVKEEHVNRKPDGWIGDDLLSTRDNRSPSVLAPDSPRPRQASKLSLNYGEYDSFRQAEIAYLNRQSSGDPDLIALQKVFYGTLQVPSRYYIMTVLGNY